MSQSAHPGNRERRRRRLVVRRGRRRGPRIRHRRRLRGRQRRRGRAPGCWCSRGRPPRAAPRRWPAATSTSAAGPPCSRPPGTTIRAEEMYKYLRRSRATPSTTRSAPTATAASSTSTGWRRWASSSSAATTPARSWCQPGTEGLLYTGNEKVWPFCEQAVPAPRGHSVPVPGELGGASMVIDLLRQAGRRARRADPLRDRRDQPRRRRRRATSSGCAGSTSRETGASRPTPVVIAAGGFAMNAEHGRRVHPRARRRTQDQAPRHRGALHPGQPQRRRPRHRAGRLGRRRRASTWTSCSSPPRRYPPEILLTGVIVNKDGQPVRRRGLLPLAHLGVRARAARPDRPT